MHIRNLKTTRPIARKDHHCDACKTLREGGEPSREDFNDKEWEAISRAKENGWQIKKGERYINQTNLIDGYLSTFKGILEIVEICDQRGYFEY